MTVLIRRATRLDAKLLAPHLRRADRDECFASYGDPNDALPISVVMSTRAFSVIAPEREEPLAIFGWVEESAEFARVWMMGSDHLLTPDRRRLFLSESRRIVDLLNARFPLIGNDIDARNTLHIRWLKWLGFTFITKRKAGPQDLLFYSFVRTTP